MEICYRTARWPVQSCRGRHNLSPAETDCSPAETRSMPAENGYCRLQKPRKVTMRNLSLHCSRYWHISPSRTPSEQISLQNGLRIRPKDGRDSWGICCTTGLSRRSVQSWGVSLLQCFQIPIAASYVWHRGLVQHVLSLPLLLPGFSRT